MSVQQRTILKFGLYELDTGTRELYRAGIRIKLAPQPLELLTALLEQPGQVVSREVLRQRLWPPNTYVDYEQGLNKAVAKLREALGDSAESPRYVETAQRAGYRFIAPVVCPEPNAVESETLTTARHAPDRNVAEDSAKPTSSSRTREWLPGWLLSSCIVLAFLTGALVLHNRWQQRPSGSTSIAARSTVDPKAEEAYLHGRYLWFGEHALASSDYFKRAVELQPDYAPAWAGLSLYYGAVLVRGRLDPAEGTALQEDAANKALRLDPSLPEAHLATCGSIFLKTWQFEAANAECVRAVQLNPRFAEVYHFQSKMLAASNRQADAVETQKRASMLDPLSRPWALGQALMQARRYDEALSETRLRLESFPHDPTLLRLASDLYRARGNPSQAAEFLEQSYRYGGDEPSAIQVREAYRRGGLKGIARWKLFRLQSQKSSRYVSPFQLALVFAQLGETENALTALTKAMEAHTPEVLWLRCYPEFDGLASDARYQHIAARLPTYRN